VRSSAAITRRRRRDMAAIIGLEPMSANGISERTRQRGGSRSFASFAVRPVEMIWRFPTRAQTGFEGMQLSGIGRMKSRGGAPTPRTSALPAPPPRGSPAPRFAIGGCAFRHCPTLCASQLSIIIKRFKIPHSGTSPVACRSSSCPSGDRPGKICELQHESSRNQPASRVRR
jgi:hypothetical protein